MTLGSCSCQGLYTQRSRLGRHRSCFLSLLLLLLLLFFFLENEEETEANLFYA